MSGVKDLEAVLKGQVDGAGATPTSTVRAVKEQLRRRRVSVRIPADAAASSTGTYTIADVGNAEIHIVACSIVPEASLTSNDTTYATNTIQVADGAGGAAVTVATQTTKTSPSGGTGDWAANVRLKPTIDATKVIASNANGTVIQLKDAKASTGVQQPARTVTVEYYESDVSATVA